MQATKLLFKIALLYVLLQVCALSASSQNILWMKGLWQEYNGTPYSIPPTHCKNTLQINEVADSAFFGIQTTFFVMDTAVRIMYSCAGTLTQDKATFRRGNIIYKVASNHAGYQWKECEACEARICSLYVEHDTLLLLIKTTSPDSACSGTIVYFRKLADFDTLTQQKLLSLYNKPPQYSSVLVAYSSGNTSQNNNIEAEKNDELDVPEDDSAYNNPALPPVLRERTNKLAQTLQITAPTIEVILLDDAEIDGDIVSLYHNNEEVLSHRTLGKEVIKYTFKADRQHAHHELVLVAENLGSIPPNTALMRIRAGDKKYELTTRANMHENAKVVIEYTGE